MQNSQNIFSLLQENFQNFLKPELSMTKKLLYNRSDKMFERVSKIFLNCFHFLLCKISHLINFRIMEVDLS